MKEWLIFILFIAQLAATIQLIRLEGWGSGVIFFLVTAIFVGLMVRVAEIINSVWARITGKN